MRSPTYEEEEEFLRESNAIEGVYDAGSLLDSLAAWRYLRSKTVLTIPIVLEVQRILMENQPIPSTDKGAFRTCRIFVGNHEGVRWQHIPLAVQDWIGLMNFPVDYDKDGKEHHSKKLHVTYEKIHPFLDGNGRTGRMFMNWWRLNNKLPLLTIKESEKEDYYVWFND